MFSKLQNKLALVTVMALAASPAFAQEETSIFGQFLGAVGLTGTQALVITAGLAIVGIAMAFKGPDLAKRVIRKV